MKKIFIILSIPILILSMVLFTQEAYAYEPQPSVRTYSLKELIVNKTVSKINGVNTTQVIAFNRYLTTTSNDFYFINYEIKNITGQVLETIYFDKSNYDLDSDYNVIGFNDGDWLDKVDIGSNDEYAVVYGMSGSNIPVFYSDKLINVYSTNQTLNTTSYIGVLISIDPTNNTLSDLNNYLTTSFELMFRYTPLTQSEFLASNFNLEGAYREGYEQGYDDGVLQGQEMSFDEGYDDGYNDGKLAYGRFQDGTYLTAVEYGQIRYDDGTADGYLTGYQNGLDAETSEAYNEGYSQGYADTFASGFEKWIVPAIIVILVLGGFIFVKNKRNEG